MRLRHAFILICAFLPFVACECGEAELIPITPGSCEPDFPCPAGFEYRLGDCREARCQADEDCCPGQRCNAAAGFCADQYVACTNDNACEEVPGQRCIDFRGAQFCGYPNKGRNLSDALTQRCDSNADCDDGRTCVGARCLTTAPCEGGCADGEVCDLDSNTCHPAPDCNVSCTEGQIAVLTDPDTMGGPMCCLLECECATLPPVPAGEYGWYASLALTDSDVIVSAYDPDFGDLVVSRFDEEGAQTSVEYVDGFPESGALVGDPNGLRGGRIELGPDVGLHTSIAVDSANVVHVAYYDADMGALAYAALSGGVWTKTLVDTEGDVGLFTSIAIAPDGTPSIAYMLREGTVAPFPDARAALKFATARSNMPSSPADWTTEIVTSEALPEVICNGGCANDQACVDLGMGPACIATTVGCGGCDGGEACVMTSTQAECVARVPIVSIDDLPDGTGLFSAHTYTSTGTPLIAFHNRLDRSLWLATGTSTGTFRVRRLHGGDEMTPLDVGQHASIAVDSMDNVGIAYMDATNDDLLYIDVRSGTVEIVDNGVTAPNLRLVGADASLIFDSAGRPAIAYQDPTNIDLIYARRMGTPAMWNTEVIDGDIAPGDMMGNASGFYVSQALRGDTAFISNVTVGFTEEGLRTLDLSVLTKRVD